MELARTHTVQDATRVRALVDRVAARCHAGGRADLAEQAAAVGARLDEPPRVLVVGDFKQGKSSLVNALVGTDVCPVDDNRATAVPTIVGHGAIPAATVRYRTPERHEAMTPQQAAAFAIERPADTTAHPAETPAAVRIEVPSAPAAMLLVDTPGLGGLGSAHAAAALAAASTADALVFVADADDALTEAEAAFLARARARCAVVVGALTKVDFFPGWRGVLARDERLAGVPFVGVSVPLRELARRTGDRDLDIESGFPALAELLAQHLPASAEVQAAAHLTAIVEMLSSVPRETAPDNPRHPVGAALDTDVRARVERVMAEADEAIDAGDPADTWPQLRPWLHARLAHELADTYELLLSSVARSLGVPEHLPVAHRPARALRAALAGPEAIWLPALGELSRVALAPLHGGVSLVMGHQHFLDEKQRQRLQRVGQARAAVREYADRAAALVRADCAAALGRLCLNPAPVAAVSTVDVRDLRTELRAVTDG